MMDLLQLNKAVCSRYRQALSTLRPKVKLVAEDVRGPIDRPCAKVELDESTDARLLAGGREGTATFRLYFFARDGDRPKEENVAARAAIGTVFLDGLVVGDTYLGIDEGLSFTVSDGVLVATLALNWSESIPEDGEMMEDLKLRTEVIT